MGTAHNKLGSIFKLPKLPLFRFTFIAHLQWCPPLARPILSSPHSLFSPLLDIFKSSSSARDSFIHSSNSPVLRRPKPPSPPFSSKTKTWVLKGRGRSQPSLRRHGDAWSKRWGDQLGGALGWTCSQSSTHSYSTRAAARCLQPGPGARWVDR